jgi:hypothetical protein
MANVYPRPLSAPREGCNPAPAVLQEWRAAVSVWAALPPTSPKTPKVCRQLLELQARLGSEASLIAQEVAHA